MGQFHFDVPLCPDDPSSPGVQSAAVDVDGLIPHRLLTDSLWDAAYLCGIEGVPFQTTVQRVGNRLTLDRRVETSARLLIPCQIEGIGFRVLATCSLRPNTAASAYRLPVELARGSCMTARTQSDVWQRSGLSIDQTFSDRLASGTREFLNSAADPDFLSSTESAIRSIRDLQLAIDSLGESYAMQSVAFRKSVEPKLATLLAAVVVPPQPIGGATQTPAAATTVTSFGTTAAGSAAKLGAATASDDPRDNPLAGAAAQRDTAVNVLVRDGPPVAIESNAAAEWAAYQSAFNSIAIRTSWADIETDSGSLNFADVDRSFDAAAAAGMRVIAGPLVDFRPRLMPHWLYLLENDFDQLLASTVAFVEKVVTRYRGRATVWNCASALNTPGPLRLNDEQSMRLAVGILQAVRRADPATATVMSFDQPCGEYLAKHRDAISPMHFADALLRTGLGLSGFGLEFRIGYREQSTLPRSVVDIGAVIDRWATLRMPLMTTLAIPGGNGPDPTALAPLKRLPHSATAANTLDPDVEQLRMAGPLVRTMLAKPIVHAILWDGWHAARSHITTNSCLIDAAGNPRRLYDYFVRLRQDILT